MQICKVIDVLLLCYIGLCVLISNSMHYMWCIIQGLQGNYLLGTIRLSLLSGTKSNSTTKKTYIQVRLTPTLTQSVEESRLSFTVELSEMPPILFPYIRNKQTMHTFPKVQIIEQETWQKSKFCVPRIEQKSRLMGNSAFCLPTFYYKVVQP